MRRYDEPIDVLAAAGDEAVASPRQFVWRRRLWRVIEVEQRWLETADWWSDPGDDLLKETEVWRVSAAAGASASVGVYDLACAASESGDPRWTMRAVID